MQLEEGLPVRWDRVFRSREMFCSWKSIG